MKVMSCWLLNLCHMGDRRLELAPGHMHDADAWDQAHESVTRSNDKGVSSAVCAR